MIAFRPTLQEILDSNYKIYIIYKNTKSLIVDTDNDRLNFL